MPSLWYLWMMTFLLFGGGHNDGTFTLCQAWIMEGGKVGMSRSRRSHQSARHIGPPTTTSTVLHWLPWKSSSTSSTSTSQDELQQQQQQQVRDLLSLARKYGPVGLSRSASEQAQVLLAARALSSSSSQSSSSSSSTKTGQARNKKGVNIAPARIPLTGVHRLVYSSAPGGSSGKLIGPLAGSVTQTFFNETHFINAMDFGPLQVSLLASRKVVNDERIQVSFHESSVSLWGNLVSRTPIQGGGQWNYVWAGVISTTNDNDNTNDDAAAASNGATKESRKKLIRIMETRVKETPSLFILEHDLVE